MLAVDIKANKHQKKQADNDVDKVESWVRPHGEKVHVVQACHVGGARVLESLPLPLKVCLGRKLESGAKAVNRIQACHCGTQVSPSFFI